MRSGRTWTAIAVAVLTLLVGAIGGPALFAQVDTGSILGTVKDASGAAIPGAQITLTNEGTGFTQTEKTHEDGAYEFTPVKIGLYSVSAEDAGFKQEIYIHVRVDIQRQVVQDFTLSPGTVMQKVQVTAAPAQLQTQDASVGMVVGSQEANDLPLNGRNYIFLAQLSPGVTFGQQDTRGEDSNGRFIANGVRGTQNDYLIDGVDNNSSIISVQNGHDFVTLTPVDGLSEFKVQTSSFSAEFGRAAGAVMNATVKSGSNGFHGDVWEFVRNDAMDGADFFINKARLPKGEFRLNQFGFTQGGVLRIPHLYNGTDHTFFFVDYEGKRVRQGNPFTNTVPTLAEQNSNFMNFSDLITDQSGTPNVDLLGRSFPLGTMLDPATTRPVTAGQVDSVTRLMATGTGYVRDAFTGNQIPSTRLDPNGVSLLHLLPLPNTTTLVSPIVSNYESDPVFQENFNTFDVRVDENLRQKDVLFVRYSMHIDDRVRPGPLGPGPADGGNSLSDANLNDRAQNAVFGETHTLSPVSVNEFRFGVSREHALFAQAFENQLGIPEQYGIQGVPQFLDNGGLPHFNVGALTQFGSAVGLPSSKFGTTPQFTDNWTRIVGTHTLKVGGEWQHILFPFYQPPDSRSFMYYTSSYTTVYSHSDSSVGLGQVLLTPQPATYTGGVNNLGGMNQIAVSTVNGHDMSRNYESLYFQDSWKMTSKFTFNYGLRWERYAMMQENFGKEGNFIYGTPFNGAQFIVPAGTVGIEPQDFITDLANDGISYGTGPFALATTPNLNFGPRVGLAYHPFSWMVMRAGYGLFYGGDEAIGGGPLLTENFPFEFSQTFTSPNIYTPLSLNGTVATMESALTNISFTPSTVNLSGIGLIGIQNHTQTDYTQDLNFSLQFQLSPSSTVTAGYVGSASRHMPSIVGTNLPTEILVTSATEQNFVPFPAFQKNSNYTMEEGNSEYNSLQVSYDRRFSGGLRFLADYTYSKCRTDARDPLENDISSYRDPYLPNFGIQGDYANCDFDIPQVVHFSGTYDLPFGQGRYFLGKSSRGVNAVFGGWKMNWILSLQSGSPFTISCSQGTSAGAGCFALMVPNVGLYANAHTVQHWLNSVAFANPPAATANGQSSYAPLGGAPTQALGPGFHRLDYSLFKQFQTSERTHLEFRVEVFNLTNHPNFGLPSSTNFSQTSTFGAITSTRDSPNAPREIQLAGKFYW